MGWRLVEEVLDHCPDVKYREFRALIALAVDARDETRKAMPGEEVLSRRANCRRRTTYDTLRSLRDRGLIKPVTAAAPGRRAVYEIPPLNETGAGMRARETGAGMRAPKRKNGGRHRRTRTGADMPALTGADMPAPPPSDPSDTPSVGGAQTAPTAQAILAAFIDWDRSHGGTLTKRTIGQLAKQIGELIGQGIDDRYIRQGLAAWRAKGVHPSALDSFVNSAMNGHARKPPGRPGVDWDAARQRAQARDAQRGELP